jgi:hypothetical protein
MAQTRRKALAAIKRWKQRNPEKVRQQRARWRERHPNYLRTWRKRNPKNVQAYRTHNKEGERWPRLQKNK